MAHKYIKRYPTSLVIKRNAPKTKIPDNFTSGDQQKLKSPQYEV